ncbi:hypothetical protein X474_02410 [Dethiosulfatarculus sandiegensis]|uniref:Uncharacterized protein n=1 Tax=Dethiosulfatarculus sandiegensis TaxID=1429043 RepID=A0A0D2HZJ5_9BACT|nr:hypothetical protein X474_02410 [Dethiosulfatarculus sandiegensis]
MGDGWLCENKGPKEKNPGFYLKKPGFFMVRYFSGVIRPPARSLSSGSGKF